MFIHVVAPYGSHLLIEKLSVANKEKRAQRSKQKAKAARKAKSEVRYEQHFNLTQSKIAFFESLPPYDLEHSYLESLGEEVLAKLDVSSLSAIELMERVGVNAAIFSIWSEGKGVLTTIPVDDAYRRMKRLSEDQAYIAKLFQVLPDTTKHEFLSLSRALGPLPLGAES
ncbi:hypothetical protein PKDLPJHF_02170 [Aeromonas veronii]